MKVWKRQKPVRVTKQSGWKVHQSSIFAGLIATIGIYATANLIALRKDPFESNYQHPLMYILATAPILISLLILKPASKKLGWKATKVFIVSLLLFFHVREILLLVCFLFSPVLHR